MKKTPSPKAVRSRDRASMRPEYDFSKGVRGKYAARLKPGSQIVVLDPDVAAAFGDAKSVPPNPQMQPYPLGAQHDHLCAAGRYQCR
jgi:hypothetical protein